MVTVATCEASYVAPALKHIAGLVDELKSKAGALTARYGVMGTGDDAGEFIGDNIIRIINQDRRLIEDQYGGLKLLLAGHSVFACEVRRFLGVI